jgi:hypothetical protein
MAKGEMGARRRRDDERWEELYQDRGCEFSPRCLECPLPACRYDLPAKQAGVWFRALKLLPLIEQGRTMEQLAADIGVSRRTVFRLMPYVRGLQGLTVQVQGQESGIGNQES